MYMRMRSCMRVSVYIYVCACPCAHTHVFVYTCVWCILEYPCEHVYVCASFPNLESQPASATLSRASKTPGISAAPWLTVICAVVLSYLLILFPSVTKTSKNRRLQHYKITYNIIQAVTTKATMSNRSKNQVSGGGASENENGVWVPAGVGLGGRGGRLYPDEVLPGAWDAIPPSESLVGGGGATGGGYCHTPLHH